MEYNHTEHLTKLIIEQEIKGLYLWKLKSCIPCALFSYIGAVVFWFTCDIAKSKDLLLTAIFVLYIIVLLGVTAYLIYLIFQYSNKNIKYSIVCDNLTKISIKRAFGYGILGTHCLCFSENGKFLLEFHRIFYPWSDFYCMDSCNLKNRSNKGDKFYLVIKNKKILNVYNQKMFEYNHPESN